MNERAFRVLVVALLVGIAVRVSDGWNAVTVAVAVAALWGAVLVLNRASGNGGKG